MSFNHGNDLCLGFWAKAWASGVIQVRHAAKVLEIGAAEADWMGPMHAERPDWDLTGLDWRGGTNRIQGDVLTYEFPPESFDLIVAISAIEHIGLGAYGDPKEPAGDILTANRVGRWLKPHGWFYFDVPYGERYEALPKFRRYDEQAVRARLVPVGCAIRWWRIFTPTHPDAPYVGVITQKAA